MCCSVYVGMFSYYDRCYPQLALIGSSSSLHSEACNALGASDGVIHSSISLEVVSLRATTNEVTFVGMHWMPHELLSSPLGR